MSDLNSTKVIVTAVAAAFGVIGAVGLFVYQKVREQQQAERVRRDLDKMGETMAELQAQLDSLRVQQNQRRNRERTSRLKHILKNSSVYSATDNDTDVDAFSTADTDFDDNEEFFDFSDMESGDGDNERISGPTNELDRRIAETDELIELGTASSTEEALSILRNLLVKYPDNLDVVWRLARACHKSSTNMTDSAKKQALVVEGIKVCERFEQSDSADFHKWYAILIGSNSMFLPMKEKIESGHRFRKHLDKALELSPKDAALYHLLGRFKFEVASLSWIERKLASTLFAEPPSATYEEAIIDFEYAEKLTEKPFKDNKLLLGKCYVAVGKYRDAIRWLEQTETIPSANEEDRISQNEADQLLSKYSKHRS